MNLRRADEAKAIVAIAFRNGPIADVHAGIACPNCAGKREYSHITQAEMKAIMKNAVNWMAYLLALRDADRDSDAYQRLMEYGHDFSAHWDEPVPVRPTRDAAA